MTFSERKRNAVCSAVALSLHQQYTVCLPSAPVVNTAHLGRFTGGRENLRLALMVAGYQNARERASPLHIGNRVQRRSLRAGRTERAELTTFSGPDVQGPHFAVSGAASCSVAARFAPFFASYFAFKIARPFAPRSMAAGSFSH